MWWFRLSALRTFTGSHHFAICEAKEMFAFMLLWGSYKLFAQGRKLMWNFIKVYVLLVLNCLSPPWAFCWTGLCLFLNVYGIALRLTVQRWITRSGTGGRLLSVSGPTVVPVTDYRFSSYRQEPFSEDFTRRKWLFYRILTFSSELWTRPAYFKVTIMPPKGLETVYIYPSEYTT